MQEFAECPRSLIYAYESIPARNRADKGRAKKLDKIGLNIIYQKFLAYGPLREQKQENQLESTNGLPQF